MKKIILAVTTIVIALAAQAQTPNKNVTLGSHLTYPATSSDLSNISGIADSLGNEYALVGWEQGVEIVNVTNPASPIRDTNIVGPVSIWREIKVYKKYAYVTTEGGSGLQIIDLSLLPNYRGIRSKSIQPFITIPAGNSGVLNTIHSLHIDTAKGNLYLYGSNVGNQGALVFNLTDPWNPSYIGSFNNNYIHDGYVDNDTLYSCHIYNGYFSIVNMTNKNNPIVLSTQSTPNNFTHNSWPSVNKKFLFTTDEVDNSYLTAYDISNVTQPVEVDRIQSQNAGAQAIGHNTHILNDYAITSWYKDGVLITDVHRPQNMVNVGWYDTSPLQGGNFDGAWGVYPFLPSGNLLVSDISQGLFVLTPTYKRASYLEGTITDSTCGTLLNGVTITATKGTTTFTTITDANGDYKTGTVDSGSYTVSITKSGFATHIIYNVSLAPGVVTIINNALLSNGSFTYVANVNDSLALTPLTNANVIVIDTANASLWSSPTSTLTNGSGTATISCLNNGTYNLYAGKWQYKTTCFINNTLNMSTSATQFNLPKKYYDDFLFNNNWTVAATAISGAWERAIPEGTLNSGTKSNPNVDAATDCGGFAFVTGNAPGAAGADDVDDGYTILTSPIMDLSSYTTGAKLTYERWFYNAGGSSAVNDTLEISITNGTQTVVLEKVYQGNVIQSRWNAKTIINLQNKISFTTTMQLIVKAQDYAPGHIMEAGFDKMEIIPTGIVSINKLANAQANISPNPCNDVCTISGATKISEVQILDLSGKIVSIKLVNANQVTINLQEMQAGIYIVKTMYDNGEQSNQKLVKTN
ncbi:MAG: choice-of-anchor B family protein [Bacteroidia bacterium]|nr:choice-of-anchor B family protein [Bacteroidia bacterium]